MRSLEKVIDQMMDVIPLTERRLRNSLRAYKGSVLYCPPESMYIWWRRVAVELEEEFCEEKDGVIQPPKLAKDSWQEQVFNIWMDK